MAFFHTRTYTYVKSSWNHILLRHISMDFHKTSCMCMEIVSTFIEWLKCETMYAILHWRENTKENNNHASDFPRNTQWESSCTYRNLWKFGDCLDLARITKSLKSIKTFFYIRIWIHTFFGLCLIFHNEIHQQMRLDLPFNSVHYSVNNECFSIQNSK